MASKGLRDLGFSGLIGLMVGVLPAMLAAGAYATWRHGENLTDIDLFTFYSFTPWEAGAWTEPFQNGLVVGFAVLAVAVLGTIALTYRPTRTTYGSAAWSSLSDIKRRGLLVPVKGILAPIFGKSAPPRRAGRYLTTNEKELPHSLVVAPTRSGKGVGVIIPTLLTYRGAILCLDVKGENFEATARQRRKMGDPVYKFSPYDGEGRTHCYNPLDKVANAPEARRFSEARRLAASLVIAKSKGAEGFLEGAREILAATTLLAIERKKPHLSTVYDYLKGSDQATMRRLCAQTEAPEARSVFERMGATEPRILSSYMSVLGEGGLSLWADPAVRAATESSDFSLDNIRSAPLSVFLVVSPNDLAVLAPLIRLFFQQSISILQRSLPAKGEDFPVLFLMDEFRSLGRMDVLSDAITTIAQYGGRFMIVVQSLPNLREHYGPDGANNFLANTPVQLYMAPADADTAKHISEAIGDTTRKTRSKSWSQNQVWSTNVQEREEGAPLIRPAELRQLGDDTVVAIVRDTNPIRMNKIRYYEDKALKAIYEGQSGDLPQPDPLSEFAETTEETASSSPPLDSAIQAPERTPAEAGAAPDNPTPPHASLSIGPETAASATSLAESPGDESRLTEQMSETEEKQRRLLASLKAASEGVGKIN